MTLCRIFGLLPITWTHVNKKCYYTVSKFWIAYSLFIAGLYLARICYTYAEFVKPFNGDRTLLLQYIAKVVEGFLMSATFYLLLITIYRSKKIVAVVNKLSELTDEDVLCSTALKKHQIISKHYVCFIVGCYIVQYSTIFALNFIDMFDTNWNYERLIMPVVQTTFIIIQGNFACLCALYLSLITCYDNKVENSLDIKSAHPIPDFEESKSIRSLFCLRYKICGEKHIKKTTNNVQLLEYLQKVFKEIKINLDTMNEAFNPQILIHMTCELGVLIIYIYAVIIFMTFDETTPSDKTNNFFNWFFIVIRITNIYGFLQLAQHVETSVSLNYWCTYQMVPAVLFKSPTKI